MSERKGPEVMILGGKMFRPLDPRPEDIELTGIVVPISSKIRFNNNIMRPYTVGMHTLAGVKECLRRWPDDYLTALRFFLHDAGEAYGPDISSPLKEEDLGALNTSEGLILACVRDRFKIPGSIMTDKVREVDLDSLKTEFDMFFPYTPPNTPGTYTKSIREYAETLLSEYEALPFEPAIMSVRRQLFNTFYRLTSLIEGVG